MSDRKTPEGRAWDHVAAALDVGWGTFTDMELLVLRGLLRVYDPQTVLAALEALTISGREFYPRPKAPQIAKECNRILGRDGDPSQFDAPTFGEVMAVAERAAWLPTPGGGTSKRRGVDLCAAELGEPAAAWFASEGYDLIRALPLGDHEYAGRNRDLVRSSYDKFIATQRARLAAGREPTRLVEGDVVRGGLRPGQAQVGAGS